MGITPSAVSSRALRVSVSAGGACDGESAASVCDQTPSARRSESISKPDWVCPDCGTPKSGFEMVEIPYYEARPQ